MKTVAGVFGLIILSGIIYEVVVGKNSVPIVSDLTSAATTITGAPYGASYATGSPSGS
jgi:hypothetical protein